MEELIRPIEYAIASFAADYAAAGNRLNPFLDAEVHAMGSAMLVYTGQVSLVHGGYGLALEGALSRDDFSEIDEFFFRMGRDPDFFVNPLTAKESLESWTQQGFQESNKEALYWNPLVKLASEKSSLVSNTPDHGEWVQKFGGNLFASTIMHMKNTRFFASSSEAGFLYFHQKHVLSFSPHAPTEELLLAMLQFAKEFQSRGVCLILPHSAQAPSLGFQKIYERTRLSKQRSSG